MPQHEKYQDKWDHDKRFSQWIKPLKTDPYSFYCKACEKTLKLSNMQERAVVSHGEGEIHKKKLEQWKKMSRCSTAAFLAPKVAPAPVPCSFNFSPSRIAPSCTSLTFFTEMNQKSKCFVILHSVIFLGSHHDKLCNIVISIIINNSHML